MALLSEDQRRTLQVYVLTGTEARWGLSQNNVEAGVYAPDSQVVWLSL